MPDLTTLPTTLAQWGLTAVSVPGWQDRRRPGSFAPIGVLIHHTAAPDRTKDNPSLQVCIDGHRDLAGPLCQLLVARSGKVYVISRGRCNHAGEGGPVGPVDRDTGNTHLVGIEAENDGKGEPWPAAQLDAMVRCSAAVLNLLERPRGYVWGHKEYAPGRKIDPAGIDMTRFRALVAAAQPHGAPMPITDHVKASQQRLNDSGVKPPLKLDGQWGPVCDAALDAVLKFQQGQMAASKVRADAEQATADALRDDKRKLTADLADAVAKREAAEAEAAKLRAELQTGGRLPALLADLDAALVHLDKFGDALGIAMAKARA